MGPSGTGKTRTYISRITNLINSGQAKPSEILAIAPTDRGAMQAQALLDIDTPMSSEDLVISFNTFANRLFREYSKTPKPIVTESEINKLTLNRLLVEKDPEFLPAYEAGYLKFEKLTGYFQTLQQFCITPDIYEAFVEKLHKTIEETANAAELISNYTHRYLTKNYHEHKNLMIAYKRFYARKKTLKTCSYNDMYEETATILDNEDIIMDILSRYKYILLDDLQDVLGLHYRILENLLISKPSLSNNCSITLFGDPDGNIYEWAGARPHLMKSFLSKLPDADLYEFSTNYRSDRKLGEAAARLIYRTNRAFETSVKEYKYKYDGKYGGLNLKEYDSIYEEINGITEILKEIRATDKGASMAVIVKSKRDEAQMLNFLRKANLVVPTPLNQYEEIAFVLNVIKAFLEPEDSLPLQEIISSGPFALPARDVGYIVETHYNSKRPMFDIYMKYMKKQYVDGHMPESLRDSIRLVSLYKKWVSTPSPDLSVAIYDVLLHSGILKKLESATPENLSTSDNITALFRAVGDIQAKLGTTSVSLVWNHLKERASKLDNNFDETDNVVHVAYPWSNRIHEYDYVIIPKANKHVWPGYFSSTPKGIEYFNQVADVNRHFDKNKEDEMRRVLYTVINRARKGVIFTRSFTNYTGYKTTDLSPFILEIFNVTSPQMIKQLVSSNQEAVEKKKLADMFSEERGFRFKTPYNLDYMTLDIFHSYYVCSKRYYFKFNAKIPEVTSLYYLFQQGILAAIKAITTQQVDLNKLSAYQDLVKAFETSLSQRGSSMSQIGDEFYERSMVMLESFRDLDVKYGDLTGANMPWNFDLELEPGKIIHMKGEFDRIYEDDRLVQFMIFPERKPAERENIDLYAKILAYCYWRVHGRKPQKVTLEFIRYYEMIRVVYIPEGDFWHEVEPVLKDVGNSILDGNIVAKSTFKTCKECHYNEICTSSALKNQTNNHNVNKK